VSVTDVCRDRVDSPRQNGRVLEVFPETAAVEDGELAVGGVRATELAEEFGTPLVVYCEQTIRTAARVYAGTGAEIVYATATTSRTRSCARPPAPPRSSCSTRPTSPGAQPQPASRVRWSG
jgi:hypothetical protein